MVAMISVEVAVGRCTVMGIKRMTKLLLMSNLIAVQQAVESDTHCTFHTGKEQAKDHDKVAEMSHYGAILPQTL